VVCSSKSLSRHLCSSCPGRDTQCLIQWSKSTAIGAVLIGLVVVGSLLKSTTSVALIGMPLPFHPSIVAVEPMTMKDDTRLIHTARSRVLSVRAQVLLEARLLNPFLSRRDRAEINARLDESINAQRIAAGISIAREFRRS